MNSVSGYWSPPVNQLHTRPRIQGSTKYTLCSGPTVPGEERQICFKETERPAQYQLPRCCKSSGLLWSCLLRYRNFFDFLKRSLPVPSTVSHPESLHVLLWCFVISGSLYCWPLVLALFLASCMGSPFHPLIALALPRTPVWVLDSPVPPTQAVGSRLVLRIFSLFGLFFCFAGSFFAASFLYPGGKSCYSSVTHLWL